MRFPSFSLSLGFALLIHSALAQDQMSRLQSAVDRVTLAQPGTNPFHLKAALAPSHFHAGDEDRTGQIEIWWMSPTHYRRELRCASFHQVEIVDGEKIWQQNDGDYLPEWLRVIAEKLIEPVSPVKLAHAQTSEVRHLRGTTYFQWTNMSSDGTVQKGMGASIDLDDATGLLRLDSSGEEKYQDFHGRKIARVVTDGSPEVKASVIVLEDLPALPNSFLDPSKPGSDAHLLRTIEVDELALRQNLQTVAPPVWPPLSDGPLDGVLTTRIILDREGHARDCEMPIADNPGVDETARNYICNLQFRPLLMNGEPVQVVSRFTMPFKTSRPLAAETFDSARNYFEQGRKAGFPATASTPYFLRADFQARGESGTLETGRYEDTFQDDQHWRRETWFGANHAVRSRNGDRRYRLEEGSQAGLADLILRITEPIPATDTFIESDWRVNIVTDNGSREIRVLSGYESPEGNLDPQRARAYWFTPSGQLVKTYFVGLETRRSDFQGFGSMQVARTIALYSKGDLALKLNVNELSMNPPIRPNQFEVKGHEWIRQFTDQVR